MVSNPDTIQPTPSGHRRSFRFLLLLLLIPALLLLVVILTPLGSRLGGVALSRILGQPVTVSRLGFSGSTLTLQGIAVRNLPPFSGELLTIRSLRIIPSLRLTGGKPSLELLEIAGCSLELQQEPGGEWNSAPTLRRLRSNPGGGELFIDTLRLRDTALKINGRCLPIMNVSLSNLATRGSRHASWQIGFSDPLLRRVKLSGTLHPGGSPTLSLAADLPESSLQGMARLVSFPSFLDLHRGSASLHLTADYGNGGLDSAGELTFAGFAARIKGRTIPLAGKFSAVVAYRGEQDEIRISRGTLSLSGLPATSGTALIRRVKTERDFFVTLTSAPLKLERLSRLLFPPAGGGIMSTGTAILTKLSLAGNARRGVISGGGKVALRNVSARRRGLPLIQGLSANLTLSKKAAGWEAVAPLSGTVMGITIAGSARYRGASPEPLTLRLRTKRASLASFSPYLGGSRVTGGSASLELELAANRELSDLRGNLVAAVEGFSAESPSGKRLSLAGCSLAAVFTRGGSRPPQAVGRISVGGTLDGTPGRVDCSYIFTPELLRLEGGSGQLADIRFTFGGVQGQLPLRSSENVSGVPVSAEIRQLNLEQGDLSLAGLSGRLTGEWNLGGGIDTFRGSSDLTARRLAWRSWSATELSARFMGDGGGVSGDIGGSGLGGGLTAVVTLAPSAPGYPGTLHVRGRRLLPAEITTAVGRSLPVTMSDGLLDADITGSFGQGGMNGLLFSTSGSGLTVVMNGAPLLGGVGVTAAGEYDRGRLSLKRGVVTVGGEVGINLSGEMNDLPAATRSGRMIFTLPESSLTTLITAYAPLLPSTFQEVKSGGTIALNGGLLLGRGKTYLEGELRLKGGMLSLPSRQFSAQGMEGRVPFSLNLAGTGEKSPSREHGFSRANYPVELAQLRRPLGKPTFRVGRVRLGSLESGESRFHLAAGGGRTELLSVETSLYDGEILGRGALSWDRGPLYDGDLLVSGLSLRTFCATIPGINGYLSGKVDGVAGLHGRGGKLNDTIGFFQIWARNSTDEEMLVSREFLQKLAGKKLRGFFFRDDRSFDLGEVTGHLSQGELTFTSLELAHTNLLGVRDLGVGVVPSQNRISLEHLVSSIRTAVKRGKPAREEGEEPPTEALPQTEFNWLE